MIGKKKGLFGRQMPMPGAISGFGGGTFNMDGTQATLPDMQNVPTTAGGAFGNPLPAQAQPKQGGMDWKGALMSALGGAADGAAQFFGGQPLIAQQQQFDRFAAFREAEQQRARALELANYRAKLEMQQQFAQPEAPKPGSFEWYQTATPEQRALYDQYNPVTVATGQGPVAVPRSSFGGAPSAPVGRLTPIDPTIQNTPAPQLSANGMPTSLTRAQYQAIVAEMGEAETAKWARRNNIRVAN